jgi:palmitoyltransferase
VVLASHIYCLVHQLELDITFDGRIIATLVIAAFFGLFTFAMSLSSFRFISVNMTNIDMLKKPMTHFLAVRVPLGTLPTDRYSTVTYPLPRGHHTTAVNGGIGGAPAVAPAHDRDSLARRTFAILKTDPGENPWDLGFKANWRDIMGPNIIDFFLPIVPSPCTKHESAISEYRLGPLVDTLRERYELPRAA